MTWLRRFLRDHRALCAGIVAVALLMKIVVPSGYMIGGSAGAVTIELCRGYDAAPLAAPAMPGMAHHAAHHRDGPDHPGKEMPCAFSGLAALSLAAADPVLLAAAIAFVHATVFRVETASVARAPAFLRPPLRGPPARA